RLRLLGWVGAAAAQTLLAQRSSYVSSASGPEPRRGRRRPPCAAALRQLAPALAAWHHTPASGAARADARAAVGALVTVGIDATAVSRDGKGISRAMRGVAEALTRGGSEIVALVRPGVEVHAPIAGVRPRPAVMWEQVGLARAGRRFDAVLTPTERLPVVGDGRFVVWLSETPYRRLAAASGLYQHGSDLVTRALAERSLR